MPWPLSAVVALMLVATPVPVDTRPEPVTLTGQVVPLGDALKGEGVAADPEPIAAQVVLKTDAGAIVPLLSDEASRALFRDDRLRRRPVEIRGLKRSGLPYLQVVTFRVEDQGRLRTPEYYCEICTISVRSPQTCPCCQGPMELRMKPESR
ncbi:MAG: hypothetical protein U0794_14750 [Isosphaeraceae bacterium]